MALEDYADGEDRIEWQESKIIDDIAEAKLQAKNRYITPGDGALV